MAAGAVMDEAVADPAVAEGDDITASADQGATDEAGIPDEVVDTTAEMADDAEAGAARQAREARVRRVASRRAADAAAFHAAFRVVRFASAATAAWHARLCRCQSLRWHSRPQ